MKKTKISAILVTLFMVLSLVPLRSAVAVSLPPISIVTDTNLPKAVVGSFYSANIEGTGSGTFNWSLSGSVPPGVSICATSGFCQTPSQVTGLIGTPTQAGTYNFTVNLNTETQQASKQFVLVVESPTINTVTVAVTAPIAGSTFTGGQTAIMSWNRTGAFDATNNFYFIYLKNKPDQILGSSSYSGSYNPILFRSPVLQYPDYAFTIPTNLTSGQYYLELDYTNVNGVPIASSTSSAFNITGNSPRLTLTPSPVTQGTVVAPGTQNLEVLRFVAAASTAAPIAITQLNFGLTSSMHRCDYLNNIGLYAAETNIALGTVQSSFDSNCLVHFVFNSPIVINGGTQKMFALSASFATSAPVGDQFSFNLSQVSTSTTVEVIGSNQVISATRTVGPLSTSSRLTLTPSPVVQGTVVTPGTQNLEVLRFVAAATEGPVSISQLNFGLTSSMHRCDYINYIGLYSAETNNLLGTVQNNFDGNCLVHFVFSTPIVIAANTQKMFALSANFPTFAPVGDQFSFNLSQVSTTTGSDVVGANQIVSATRTIGPLSSGIRVTAPERGEQWQIGNTYKIVWDSANVTGNVNISLYNQSLGSGGLAYIAKNVANSGVYEWNTNKGFAETLPSNMSTVFADTDYVIFVSSVNNTQIHGESAVFSLVSPSILPPPPPPLSNKRPLGWIDAVNNGFVDGWALDPNHLGDQVTLNLYFDSTASQPVIGITDIVREDVNKVMSASGLHGFHVAIPPQYADGKTHRVYAVAVDADDTSGNSNGTLFGSGKSFVVRSVTNISRHPRGSVVIDAAGTVFFMGNAVRYPFPNPEVFFSWGHTFSEIVQANDADLVLTIGPTVEILR